MTKPLAISRNLPFMCLLSFSVGIIAGLGAWAFRMLIGFIHNILFLGKLQCYYDANVHAPGSPWGPWVILVPVAGALLVAWLVKTFAPEAKGHGVPEVMDAIYYNDSKIRPVVGLIKAVASAVCIGSGGSVGREGPIIQIGGVAPPHIGGSKAQLVVRHQYIMTPEKNSVNDLLREMHTTGAKFALATGTPGTPIPHEIIGIVAEREVAASTMKEAELK